MNLIAKITAGLVLISMIGGGAWYADDRFAKQEYVETVAGRLDTKILEDRAYRLRQRIWALEDRYGPNCGKRRDECRRLKYELDQIRRKLKQ